jgi:hypothetical protein
MKALGGCVMELDDCAFPLLTKVVQTDKLEVSACLPSAFSQILFVACNFPLASR